MIDQIVIPMGSAIVGALVALGLDRQRHMRDVLKHHQVDIKERILSPIIELTSSFYLPCFESKENPVEQHHLGHENGRWTYSPRNSMHEASYRQSNGGFVAPGYYQHSRFEEGVLFEDVQRSHYPDLLSDWLKLRAAFKEYSGVVMNVASADAEALENTIGVRARLPNDIDSGGLNYHRLAMAMLNERLGFSGQSIRFQENREGTEIKLWTQDSIGTISTEKLEEFRSIWQRRVANNDVCVEAKQKCETKHLPLAKSVLRNARWAKESLRGLEECNLTS
jgi:hypothetical protein